jgi:hypothetical protein
VVEHLPCKQRVGSSNLSTGFDNMKDKRIKKIFKLSKRKKSQVERGFSYRSAIFLGLVISLIIFGLEVMNDFLFSLRLFNYIPLMWVKFVEFILLTILTVYSMDKVTKILSAIRLQDEKITSLKKAKEVLSKD